MEDDLKIFIGNKNDLRERVISGTDTNVEIYNCLMLLSKSVGEKITEYHWREFCFLMKMMEDEKMIVVR